MDLKFSNHQILAFFEDKLARSVVRELSGTYSNKNHRQFAANLLRTHQRFSGKYFNFCDNVFVWLSQNWASSNISSVFQNFSDNSPKISRELHGRYTIMYQSIPSLTIPPLGRPPGFAHSHCLGVGFLPNFFLLGGSGF